jgi:hypothetical protein
LRPRFDAEEGIAVEGIIFEDIADLTPVSYHTITAANGEIFSLEIIKWFEIAGLTGRRAHETTGGCPKLGELRPMPILSSFDFFADGAPAWSVSFMI